jgi:hypothetical protein
VTAVSGHRTQYSGRKITEGLGNVSLRVEKDGKFKGGARWSTVCLSMFSITEKFTTHSFPPF